MIAMEVSELSGTDTDVDGLKIMLKNKQFWVKVMNIPGNSFIFKPVKNHNIFIKAHNMLDAISQQLLSRNIKCPDVKKLDQSEKEAGVSIVDLLTSVAKNKSKELEKAWEMSKQLVSKIEETLVVSSNIISQLKKGIKHGVFPDMLEIQEAEVYFAKKKEMFYRGCVYVSELEDCSFISQTISLYFNRNINGILESMLFLTVSVNLVNEILEKPIEEFEPVTPEEDISKLFNEEDHEDIRFPAVILSILKMFNSKGIDVYKEAWIPLFMEKVQEISEIKDIINTSNLEHEIKYAERVLNKEFPKWILDSLQMCQEYRIYEEKVQTVKRVLNVFHIDEKEDEIFHETIESFYALKNSTPQKITLKQLHRTKEQLSLMDKIIDEEFFDILKELSKASTLVEFLRETVEDDLRQLIDSVEEHSEQFIQESTISALIDVRRFLNSILKTTMKMDKMDFVFKTLEKAASINNKTYLAVKINDCCTNIHGLKSLYKHVSNRGELTKDIINKVVNQKGTKFIFELKENGTCVLLLQYKVPGLKVPQSLSDLDDLRSRALLLVNTENKRNQTGKPKQKQQKDLKLFINSLDSAMCIAGWFEKLAQCGHPDYVSKKKITTVAMIDLEKKINNLEHTFEDWMTLLHKVKSQYDWLNWFFPEQLFKIKDFLTDGSYYKEVATLFEYVGCAAGFLDEARNIFNKLSKDESDSSHSLHLVGKTLESVLKNIQIETKCFPADKGKSSGSQVKIADTVQEHELFVAALGENSKLVIPTILSIYKNTTGFLPLPHQMLFCSAETKWDCINLLLQRCVRSERLKFGKQLYCIVGVEKLSNEVQFKLVDELKQLKKDIPFLAIICQGGSRHPFLDHFDTCVHHVQPMTQNTVESCFRNLWPDVVTVTSDVAGQGKTELIYDMADTKDLGVCTVHISGDVNSKELISRMSELNLLPHHVLHIDIGMVSDPSDLDLLLFQLIILGFLVDGSSLFKLPTQHISIEIANSINNVLQNSLQSTMCFIRKCLQWENFTNFKIGQEICSSVQVVCCYLNSMENGTLDTDDLYFSGVNTAKCLSAEKCQALLRKHFSSSSDLSFSTVNICLSVLADQLKKLSCSMFFRSSNLLAMLGEEKINNVKSTLMRALLDFSKEFSTRSVQACRAEQVAHVSQTQSTESAYSIFASAASMTKRVENMIQWAESNHLIVTFHNSDIQTLSALYRDKNLVPEHIKNLFEMQVRKPLPEFCSLDQKQLQEMLQRIARSRPGELPQEILDRLGHDYALTPDNLLKMILIILRIEAHVPIIIMGETGCGKTSLIRYLAIICDVNLHVQNIHAGTNESKIIECVMEANAEAIKNIDEPVWMFLDEINTCNHLGLINDIICHHRCQDVILAPNLVLMAACNPYRLRNENSILTAGLTMKVKTDEQSKLVYRVNPLPETMVDYVWDYGTLSEEDEKSYIRRMVDNTVSECLNELLVQLLVMSQNFIKNTLLNESCVSLRDVSRCKRLIGWFKMTLQSKYQNLSNEQYEIRSIILALAHSYHSRLATNSERHQYREEMSMLFNKVKTAEVTTENDILNIIVSEQKDILKRMHLPEGTATNTALQENVFVIMVCILNRIPIFVVGKPGCSKSLSLQLIKSNLRGKDSEDDYFRKLPQLYCVSYQGSESSTSDGIIKVFEKAKRYRKHNKEDDVLPVVILDEIGLAEVSRFNPLKVLHSLLEPGDMEVPEVAVVGISNWALDAAKMNRAIHLSRPDMDEQELYLTGISISEASVKDDNLSSSLLSIEENPPTTSSQKVDHKLLKAIATAYMDYTANQRFSHFHGLRDYYSLVKYISREISNQSKIERCPGSIMIRGLLRNFGGLPSELNSVVKTYKQHLEKANLSSEESFPEDTDANVVSLIKENICDPGARHLLLTTCGDSALSIIESILHEMEREYELIMGSQFEEDLTDDYNYRILSRIILCMEQGIVLILKDLDNIYGSLYDMLNQNYTVVGKKKNCRIAHGAYSNPLCHVHDNFRCIVLVDEGKLDMSDPPFLNRFEKQNVRLASILTNEETKLVEELNFWLQKAASVEGFPFTEQNLVPVFTQDMLSSLVHHIVIAEKKKEKDELKYDITGHVGFLDEHSQMLNSEILAKCKDTLLQVCSPDGIVRMERSVLPKDDFASEELKERYFQLPLHDGLDKYVLDLLQSHPDELHKLIVFTHSNLHSDIGNCLKSVSSQIQIEKLSAFKSEKQLSNRVHHFWLDNDDEWLIIQCSSQQDMMNFLLMKSIVERHRYKSINSSSQCTKNVIIVIHLEREHIGVSLDSINFLSGWILAFIDKIECPSRPLTSLLDKTLEDLIKEQRPLTSFVAQHLFWAFTCIGYIKGHRTMDSLKDIITKIASSEEILHLLEELMVEFVCEKQQKMLSKENWQLDVACNMLKLYSASTLHSALENEIDDSLKPSLAALVYQIELKNAWDVLLFASDNNDVLKVWKQCAFDRQIINIVDIPAPVGPQCYPCPCLTTSLQYPFVYHFLEKIANLKPLFMENLRSCKSDLAIDDDGDDDGDDLNEKIKNEMCKRFKGIIQVTVAELFQYEYSGSKSDYFTAFCRYISALQTTHMSEDQKHSVIMLTMKPLQNKEDVSFPEAVTELHVIYWLHESYVISSMNLVDACLRVTDMSFENLIEECFSNVSQSCVCVDKSDFLSNDTHEDADSTVNNTWEENVSVFAGGNTNIHENSDDESDSSVKDTDDCGAKDTDSDNDSDMYVKNAVPLDSSIAENTSYHSQSVENYTNMQDTESNEQMSKYKLVTYCCKLLIPSKSMSDTFCIEEWQQSVSLVLSLSSEVSLEPEILQFLRVCSDFAALIIVPYKLPNDILLELGENVLLKGLDSDDFLCYIFAVLSDIRERISDSEKVLQHFLTCYLSSCLSANPDSQILTWTFKHLKENMVDEGFSFFGPTVHQALFMEVSNGLDILNDEHCANNEFIKILDSFLIEFGHTQDGALNLATLVVDILFHYFIKPVGLFQVDETDSSAAIKEMLRCQTVLLDEDKLTFRTLVAVAFLKTIIKGFSCDLTKKHLNLDQYSYELQQIASVFQLCENDDINSDKNKKIKAVQNMFLRYLIKGDGLKQFDEVKHIISEMAKCPETEIDLEQRLQLFEHNPCRKHGKQEKAAFDAVKSETTLMNSLLKNASESPEFMMRIYSFAIHQLYLVQSVRSLTDTERNLSETFINCCKESSLSPRQIDLLQCLCVTKDFAFPLLQISSATDSRTFSMASVLAHLFSIVTAHHSEKTSSVLAKCLQNPAEVNSLYLFSCPDPDVRETLAYVVADKLHETMFCGCSCGFVTATTQDDEVGITCSACKNNFSDGQKTSKTLNIQNQKNGTRGYSCLLSDLLMDPVITVRRLSPIAFRILTFFLHGCFAGSFALNYATTDDLAKLLSLPDNVDTVSYLREHLNLHWKALKTLTLFGDAQLCKFLHSVIDDQQDLLLRSTSKFLYEREREEFEMKFDQNISLLVKDRFAVIQEVLIAHSKDVDDSSALEFEKTLEDICTDDELSKRLARLFRITSTPSINNMQIEFLNSTMKSEFPFLGLVFEKHQQLQMMSDLLPLVQWHLCTVRYMSHNLKRSKSYETTLQAFISKSEINDDEESIKALHGSYESFTKSWNGLKNNLAVLQRYNPDIVKMERINKESNLSESLVMDDTSPLLQVMTALQNMHNEFLDKAVIISLCLKCHSTSFLRKSVDTVVIPSMNLEDITQRDVISNPLDEDLLKFSQCNTNPGCGLQRDYDFYQIEMQVADTCLINKSYLKIGADFPRIIFAGEMLRMSKTLFDEIHKMIEQKPLDKELENSVRELKGANPGNLQGLLSYLEMAFSLLTRNPLSRQDVDQNLTDLLQQWQSLIAVQIPAVTNFCSKVHLQHVIALYEFVELLMADIVIESLEEKYNKPIPEDCNENLQAVAQKASILLLDALICALKRFAFRYLFTSSLDANDSLSPCLMDATLWPKGIVQKVTGGTSAKESGMLTPELAIKHTVCTIQFFVDALEAKKRKLDVSGSLLYHSDKQGKAQKRKAAQKFRKK